jgi:chloramphenicol-sensitive protein RarD
MPKLLSATVLACAAGILANVILGASSLFWHTLSAIRPETLLCYRIVLSLASLLLVRTVLGRHRMLAVATSGKLLLHHLMAALLVAVNWGTFISASINGKVMESGIGYLIAPIIAIGLGTFLLGERMSAIRQVLVAVIIAGILLLLVRSSELDPAVYLIIGVTWGGYAYLKKTTPLDAFTSLFVETASLSLFLSAAIPVSSLSFALPDSLPFKSVLLLTLCGLVSIVPLWLFAFAARNLALSVIGLFQFVLPTTQLAVALIYYRQAMSGNTLICFCVIWTALCLIVSESLLGGLLRNVRCFGRAGR